MTMGQACKTAWSRYAVFDGRASRSEYWYWILATSLFVHWPLGILGEFFTVFYVLSIISSLGLALPTLAVTCRRLHDTNRTGWWQIVPLIISFVVVMGFAYVLGMSEVDPYYVPSGGFSAMLIILGLGGLVFVVFFIIWLAQDSDSSSNQYGRMPSHKSKLKDRNISSTQAARPNVRSINEGLDRKCFHCGTAIDTAYNFCHVCGHEQPKACKGCGAPLNSGNFCGICGVRLTST